METMFSTGEPISFGFQTGSDIPSNAVTSPDISQIVAMTQSEYDSLPAPNPTTLYIITEEGGA